MVETWENKFHATPQLTENLQINITELTFSGMNFNSQVESKSEVESKVKSKVKTEVKILEIVRKDPKVTYIELANMLGLSESGIYKSMSKLRTDGKIKRVEGKNGGHWEIIE